jgi:hypothetical protein
MKINGLGALLQALCDSDDKSDAIYLLKYIPRHDKYLRSFVECLASHGLAEDIMQALQIDFVSFTNSKAHARFLTFPESSDWTRLELN